MKIKYYDHGVLNDEAIISTLEQAIKDYQNGEIIDVMDDLQKIINAIKKYEKYEII